MKPQIMAALLCSALLTVPVAHAEGIQNLPEAASKSDAALVHIPQQGPQETNAASAAAGQDISPGRGPLNDSADDEAVDGTFTTTLATASESSSETAVPDKAFTAKSNAQHNGSFKYLIDVKEPPFRGLEPDLELDYDSNQTIANNAAHQNWLGLGWSLRGFSVIERASAGRGTPFYNDAFDTYLLDGTPNQS
jgi:hypothetical protein